MHSRWLRWTVRGLAAICLLTAVALLRGGWTAYQASGDRLPLGQVVAGVPVGGLSRAAAAQRLEQVYSTPVELRYEDAAIQMLPAELGFKLDTPGMLASAGGRISFWEALLGRQPAATQVPLAAQVDTARLRAALASLAGRYDRPAEQPRPVPGGVDFTPGAPGVELDVDESLPGVEAALRSPAARRVELSVRRLAPGRPRLAELQAMLQVILQGGGDAFAEISLVELGSGERLDFSSHASQALPAEIAFTAASTIKIPVMISVLRRVPEPVPEDVLALLRQMIAASDNPSTDAVVQQVVNAQRGPLDVTADLRALGYRDTFWAGYFYDGAPLLEAISTPAGQNPAFDTHPDAYNQTTAAEMADLLGQIHACAVDGTGKLTATFPGEITPAKCGLMVDLLRSNPLPVLVEAGLPEGTPAGHKHGWVTGPDGLVHIFADAALIDSPGGAYTLAIYLYSNDQLLFDPVNLLFARLSRAVYNCINLPSGSQTGLSAP